MKDAPGAPSVLLLVIYARVSYALVFADVGGGGSCCLPNVCQVLFLFHVRCYETLKEVRSQTSVLLTHIFAVRVAFFFFFFFFSSNSLETLTWESWTLLGGNNFERWNVFFAHSDETDCKVPLYWRWVCVYLSSPPSSCQKNYLCV